MRVILVDDSVPFDGDTPSALPLGGVEKSFAYLAGALARAGHEVRVFNRCPARKVVDGAVWETWEATPPAETDMLIAHRKPSLLDFVPEAGRRVLWVAGPGAYLSKGRNRARLDLHKPLLVFLSRSHLNGWENEDDARASVLGPGLGPAFLSGERPLPAEPPHALVTTNPLHGLDWLLDIWVDKVHPVNPAAKLHLYSAALEKGLRDEPVAEAYKPALVRVRAAAEKGVVVMQPLADAAMAAAYRAARVHLYPGTPGEVYAYTLAESQSCGLPAVARRSDATRDRIVHGASGFLEDDADAFANAALRLLNDDATYKQFSSQALAMQRGRAWEEVAAELEAHWR